MAQIGSFTRDDDGAFTGTIRTLNINTKATIKPVAKDNERSPDYRVTANGVEFGAGWSKAAKDTGAEYLSLKLDDPSFTGPVYADPGPRREGRAQAPSGRADPTRGVSPPARRSDRHPRDYAERQHGKTHRENARLQPTPLRMTPHSRTT